MSEDDKQLIATYKGDIEELRTVNMELSKQIYRNIVEIERKEKFIQEINESLEECNLNEN